MHKQEKITCSHFFNSELGNSFKQLKSQTEEIAVAHHQTGNNFMALAKETMSFNEEQSKHKLAVTCVYIVYTVSPISCCAFYKLVTIYLYSKATGTNDFVLIHIHVGKQSQSRAVFCRISK